MDPAGNISVPGVKKKPTIIHLDADCYEVQVWVNKLRPELIDKDVPIAVINPDRVIVSLNYTAKSLGAKRTGTGGRRGLVEARLECKEKGQKLIEVITGERFGKVDTFFPKIQSDEILKVLQDYADELGLGSKSSIIIERSSNDEFYIDATSIVESIVRSKYEHNSKFLYFKDHITLLTEDEAGKLSDARKRNPCKEHFGKPVTIMETEKTTPLSGDDLFYEIQDIYPKSFKSSSYDYDYDKACLIEGALIAQTLVERIRSRTTFKYQLSAGIGHSKLEAKLACSRNKPEGITIMDQSSHSRLRSEIGFQSLPGFGSSTGAKLRELYEPKPSNFNNSISTIEQLLWVSLGGKILPSIFQQLDIPNAASAAKQLQDLCYFKDETPVVPNVDQIPITASISVKKCKSWLIFHNKVRSLSMDIENRIEYYRKQGRSAQELVVKTRMRDNKDKDTKVPCDFQNKLALPRQGIFDLESIYQLIINYCHVNNLHYLNIAKINLTARKILVREKGPGKS